MSEVRRVLVTGAAGFVGRALLRELEAQGTQVVAVVRKPIAPDTPLRRSVVADIGSPLGWEAALEGCDAVVHLAARVHQMQEGAGDASAEYMRINVDGTRRLAEAAVSAGIGRFVFVSSIKVNGEATSIGMPFTESDAAAPGDPYGVSKAAAEACVRSIAASTSMAVTIVRPPLVYGPGVRANFFSMTRWLARGVPLPLGGITKNRRSLVALDNLLSLLLLAMTHPQAANETFLAADGEDVSTTELLRRTARALGVTPRLVPIPVPVLQAAAAALGKGAVAQRLCGSLQVDASKARALLGWVPPVSLDEGLRRTVGTGTG